MSFGIRETVLEQLNEEAAKTRNDLRLFNRRLTQGMTDLIHRVDYPEERMREAADHIHGAADLQEEKPSLSPYEHESGDQIMPYKVDISNEEISIDIEGLNNVELYERVGSALNDYFEQKIEGDIETDLTEVGESLAKDYR